MDFPGVLEISDFKFRLLKKILINNQVPSISVNLLAVSSRFGIVFVGHATGFKALRLDAVLHIDAEANKPGKETATDYLSVDVYLPYSPITIALSCDELTLAVCVIKGNIPVVELYDVRSFVSQNALSGPFNEVRLSTIPGTSINEFVWNPVLIEMFAVCLTDGSLTVYEVANESIKITGTLAALESILSLCWSPKGKQIVAGKKDGSLVQYKPTLQPSKIIQVPPAFESGVSVVSVCWLSTTLFATVYVPHNGDDKTPNLVLVSVPKGTNASYANFGDVCYGNGDKPAKYFMHHLPEWKVLICTSNNSLETTVIGMDENQAWQQWILEDTARAELPVSNGVESFPIGVGIINCSQHRIIISATETLPPMPILFLLSTEGLLCPMHIINLASDAVNLNSHQEALTSQGEPRKGKGLVLPNVVQTTTPLVTPQHLTTQMEASGLQVKANLLPRFSEEIPLKVPQFPLNDNNLASSQHLPTQHIEKPTSFSFSPLSSTNSNIASPITNALNKQEQPLSLITPKPTLPGDSSLNQTRKTSRPVLTPIAPSKSMTVGRPSTELIETTNSSIEKSYAVALIDEVKEFDEEVSHLKALLQNASYTVGSKEEMGQIRGKTQDVQEYCEAMKKTMQSLSLEIHSLKEGIFETFSMLEEARSLDVRNKDPVYLGLLRGRLLDPVSARRLKDVRKMIQYLQSQIQEVNRKLDQDWEDHLGKKKQYRNLNRSLPGTEMIYRTLSNNLKVIRNLEEKVEATNSEMKQKRLTWVQTSLANSRISTEKEDALDLSSLADSLLETRISEKDKVKQSSHHFKAPKPITREKEKVLRDFLTSRRVTVVKARQITKLTDSHILSPISKMIKTTKPVLTGQQNAPTEIKTYIENPVPVLKKPEQNVSKGPSQVQAKMAAFQAVVNQPSALPIAAPQTSNVGLYNSGVKSANTLPPVTSGILQGLPPTNVKLPYSSISECTAGKFDQKITVMSNTTFNSEMPPNVTAPFSILPSQSKTMTVNTLVSAVSPSIPKTIAQTISIATTVTSASVISSTPAAPTFSFGKPLSTSTPASSLFSFAPNKTAPASGQFRLPDSITKPVSTKSDFQFRLPQTEMKTPTFSFAEKLKETMDEAPISKDPLEKDDQYEDITPPETPQIEENTAPEIPEETGTVIEVSLNQGRGSGPSVKVSNSPADFSFKLPSATTTPSSSFTISNLAKSDSQIGAGASAFTKQHLTSTKIQPTFAFSMPQSSSINQDFGSPTFTFAPVSSSAPSTVPSSNTPSMTITAISSPPPFETPSTPTPPTFSKLTPTTTTPSTTIQQTTTLPTLGIENIKTSELSGAPLSGFTPVATEEPLLEPTITTETTTAVSQPSNTNNQGLFSGSITPLTTTISAFAATSTAITTAPSFFGGSPTTPVSATVVNTVFGGTVTSSTSLFGKRPTSDTSASSPAPPIFGGQTTTESTAQAQQSPGSPFVQTGFANSPGSTFGQANQAPVFGATTTTTSPSSTGVFGQPVPPATTFGAPASPAQPAFGQASASPGFGAFGQQQQSPGTGFAQGSPFGQTKPMFGQTGNGVFGQPQSPNASGTGLFGQPSPSSGGLFGQGGQNTSFFGGLGGKPSAENVNKNVFGVSSFQNQSPNPPPVGLFGTQSASNFDSGFGTGSGFGSTFRGGIGNFSGGGTSVAQTGFGAFQQSPQQQQQPQQQTPTKPSGFGTSPGFGAQPVFGGSASFGTGGSFGLANTSPQPTFGSTFGGTATNARFEALGSQAPSFGSLTQPGVNTGFNATTPTFGSLSSFGAGQQQSSGFGSQSSAFTQWRQ